MKILVADDSKTNLAIITASLEMMGHEVVSAANGEAALATYKANKPDLIILDVMMEGMDGFECAKQIRAIDSNEWIPIIFLSASVDDESISKGIDAGGDDYLTKPCSEVTLAAKVKAMQRISDMRQRLFETTEKLYLMSSTDPLTGIFNRYQFERSIKEIIAAADRFKHLSALLFIDLDNFKNINDSFGHHIGDLLLVEVAKRIRLCLRSNDFIARLGGDEFAVILSQIDKPEEADAIAQKIINTLSNDYHLDDHRIRNGASIGIACYPLSATNQESLVLNADIAMYHAKASGRNNFKCFTDDLNDKYKQQISIEHALKFALERREFYLTYQPIYELSTMRLAGMETLLCWDHPKFGLVSPNIFIPIAEETGLINHIGQWIVNTACQEAAGWPLKKFDRFKFAINISSCQLHNENFYDDMMQVLRETKISPHNLELELTETAVMTYTTGSFKESIIKLSQDGVSISIDDFGTGYSSLVRLKHLPISTLKIEKTFIQDALENANGAIIVNCLVALGKNLKLNVIAEGIETEAQLDFLKEMGCPYGQGYYLGKPMRADKAAELLSQCSVKEKV